MTALPDRLEAATEGKKCWRCKGNGGVFTYGREAVHWDRDRPCPTCGAICEWLVNQEKADG